MTNVFKGYKSMTKSKKRKKLNKFLKKTLQLQ
jgi:hypothetical protein